MYLKHEDIVLLNIPTNPMLQNWFQNRRAKSKQDAKKAYHQAAVGTNEDDGQHMGEIPSSSRPHSQSPTRKSQTSASPQSAISNEVPYITPQFMGSSFIGSPANLSSGVNPLSLTNGLGIIQGDFPIQTKAQSIASSTMSPHDLLNNGSFRNNSTDEDIMDAHRRTLTQAQFDSFSHVTTTGTSPKKMIAVDNKDDASNDSLKHFFPELDAFDFGDLNGQVSSPDLQLDFSSDNVIGDTTITKVAGLASHTEDGSIVEWSGNSTPALSLSGEMTGHADSGYAASESAISPRAKIPSGSWLPGTALGGMESDFQEAAKRAESQPSSDNQTQRSSPTPIMNHISAMSMTPELPFASAEQSSGMMTNSFDNMGLSSDGLSSQPSSQPSSRNSSISGTIAARRQRPKPQPLTTSSLRSASYCNSSSNIPATAIPGSAPPAPTLRRIKSSNVMNGFSGGRIQKNISGQRSPLNLNFAENLNSPKFARRVSSFSNVHSGLSSLAPPTPLSPSEMNQRLEMQRQSSQMFGARQLRGQPSISELHEESHSTASLTPTTPNYATQFMRTRLGVMAENTPPQSAPASRQCFPSNLYGQTNPISYGLTTAQILQQRQQQQAGFMSFMATDPSHVGLQQQQQQQQQQAAQMQAGQYLGMLQAQQQQIAAMTGQTIPYNNLSLATTFLPQQTNTQYTPITSVTPSMMLQQQHQQQSSLPNNQSPSRSIPTTDFFIHQYSPSQDSKTISPRKSRDPCATPKSYTFTNQIPEHFEKMKMNTGGDARYSPDSILE